MDPVKVYDLTMAKGEEPAYVANGMVIHNTNNSFAIAIGSVKDAIVTAYTVIELIPKGNRPVSYPKIYKQIILPLVKSCNVVYVGADRWNSINFLQQIEEDTNGRTKYHQLTMQVSHFDYFKELVNSSNLILPALDVLWPYDRIEAVANYRKELKGWPVEHLYLQFMTVKETLGSFGKGEGYTDDVFRALSVMSTMLFIPKIRKYLEEMRPMDRIGNSNRSVVMIAGRSGLPMIPYRR